MIFSIIITTYNYDRYIKKAVDSAINQDFTGQYEVIVVDDCSTDSTSLILDQYENIIRINNKINHGLEMSANKGIKKSCGTYIVRLDADDYLESYFLSEIYKNVTNENTFYYSNYTLVSENDTCLTHCNMIDFEYDEVICRGDFLASGTVYSKKMLLHVGLYSEKIKNCGLENYELILALINKGYVGKHLDKRLFFYRRHDKNLSIEKIENIMKYGGYLAEKYSLDCYKVNQYHPYLKSGDMTEGLSKYINY